MLLGLSESGNSGALQSARLAQPLNCPYRSWVERLEKAI